MTSTTTDWGMMERLVGIVEEMTDDELDQATENHTTSLHGASDEQGRVYHRGMLVLIQRERASREA